MENREDLTTVLPLLPLKLEHGSLVWPPKAIDVLTALSKGPSHSRVASGKDLFSAIKDIRDSLFLSPNCSMPPDVGLGYALFFDEVLPREESAKWFAEVVPVMANLSLRFPSLLMSHYKDSSDILDGVETGLRLLDQQCPGIVILSQELIAALLSCSFFCLFPTNNRRHSFPKINFGDLFGSLYQRGPECIKHKIKCIIHYFERVCSCMPKGYLSFERKVLSLQQYDNADFWEQSVLPLCQFQVYEEGKIEDHKGGSLEVDFADEFFGGLIMGEYCDQEEVYFLMHPELVAGMFFLPSMSDNEAIEVIGAERCSNYSGYATTFRFTGDCTNERERDSLGRRKTRIVAIDAIPHASVRQYQPDMLLREVNKAFCGFRDHFNYQLTPKYGGRSDNSRGDQINSSGGSGEGRINTTSIWDEYKETGVVTGNWGCGIFRGDPQLKSMLQWIAATQASRPFVSYYTFSWAELNDLDQVVQKIQSLKWRVGDLWKSVADYSSKRMNNETNSRFFAWLLPSLPSLRLAQRVAKVGLK